MDASESKNADIFKDPPQKTSDERHPVENVINNAEKNLSKMWLSSPFDKSRRLEAEFQFERASGIYYIDIGNSGSCTVDIYVGSSAWPKSQPYISLISSISFMTFADIKAGASSSGVKMFNQEDMNEITHSQRYDRIRIICHQPYMKPFQFGLSFLNLRNKEMDSSSISFKPEEFYSKNAIESIPLDWFDQISTPEPPRPKSFSMQRGRKMVDLAMSNKIATTMTNQSEEEELDDFQIKVTLFLTSQDVDSMEMDLNDCEEQFEEKNIECMTIKQKSIFKKVYYSVFSQTKSNEFLPFSSSSKCTPKDYSNIRRKGKRSQERAPSPVALFDNIFASKRMRSSLAQSRDDDDDDENFSDEPVIIDLADESSSSSSANPNFYRAEDFVQFDGSVPSTSKDTSYVNCPICSKQFHVTDIENHAASCEDFSNSNVDDSDDDEEEDRNSSVVLRPKNILPPYHLTKC